MNIVSRAIAATGWSPSNRSVLIHIDDTDVTELINTTLKGVLSELVDSNVAVITLDEPIQINALSVSRVQATSRHQGFDFYRLRAGFIAAGLSILSDEVVEVSTDTTFATGSIKLS